MTSDLSMGKRPPSVASHASAICAAGYPDATDTRNDLGRCSRPQGRLWQGAHCRRSGSSSRSSSSDGSDNSSTSASHESTSRSHVARTRRERTMRWVTDGDVTSNPKRRGVRSCSASTHGSSNNEHRNFSRSSSRDSTSLASDLCDATDGSLVGRAQHMAQRVHIKVQLRNVSKCLTRIEGLPAKVLGRPVAYTKVLRAMKQLLQTSGTLRRDRAGNPVLTLQGDCWRAVRHFLVREGLVESRDVECHGAMGDGLAGLSIEQLERALAFGLAGGNGRQRFARRGPAPEGVHSPNSPPPPAPSAQNSRFSSLVETISALVAEAKADTAWQALRSRLARLSEERGRRAFKAEECVQSLEEILSLADAYFGPDEVLTILCRLARAEHDVAMLRAEKLGLERWHRACRWLGRALEIARAQPTAGLKAIGDAIDQLELEKDEDPAGAEKDSPGMCCARGRLLAELRLGLLRLDSELWKTLRLMGDARADESTYLRQAGCMMELLDLLANGHEFFKRPLVTFTTTEWTIATCILGSVHTLPKDLLWKLADTPRAGRWLSEAVVRCHSLEAWMRSLCAEVCEHGDHAARTRAVLQLAYSHALHDRFQMAQLLLFRTDAIDHASQLGTPEQILCNRTVAQLGLCAFRTGRLLEVRTCLHDLCSRGRARTIELLGQGAVAWFDRTPRHLHLDVELIEAVYLASSMLLEAPSIAAEESGLCKSFPISPSPLWRELLRVGHADYNGPPEDRRECVVAAAACMRRAEWEACAALLERALEGWSGMGEPSELQALLRTKVKETALQVYLHSCANLYQSLELSGLAAMFGVDEQVARPIVSRLMIEERIPAVWDESSHVILFIGSFSTRLHEMARSLTDLVSAAALRNERQLGFRIQPLSKTDIAPSIRSSALVQCRHAAAKAVSCKTRRCAVT